MSSTPLPLPDPKLTHGPYRPFACDPGWSEAWWWFWIPLLLALFVIASSQLSPGWYLRHVLPEGYGALEFLQFVLALGALYIAVRLLFRPFVRARPLVFTVTLLGALGSLYIAGEEMSWGQHFFHWNTPEYWALVNRQQETNLHNTYYIFEKLPRSILEIGVVVGGILVPLAAYFYPWLRACRVSLFLPAAAILPAAIGVMLFKGIDRLQQINVMTSPVARPSETVETYLYLFILFFFIVYRRRIGELEAAQGAVARR
jgi:hypothetical protein